MQTLVTSEQIREHEAKLINKSKEGFSLKLMERAGNALGEELLNFKEPYLFICGKGNNGGDGFVAAKYLSNKKVNVITLTDIDEMSCDAKENFKAIKDYIKLEDSTKSQVLELINKSNTIIDCILGTGVKGNFSELLSWLISEINNSKKDVVACDIPTGVNPNSGNISIPAIKANTTVTFGFSKLGINIYPAKELCGKIKIIDIGLPEIETNYSLLDKDFAISALPKRKINSNKGSFGKTLVVAGSKEFPGAALLTSKAASSIGSGLTALSTDDDVFNQITKDSPEITHLSFSLESILEESKKSSCCIVGPGLTCNEQIKSLVKSLIENLDIPIILDADGINAISENKEIILKAKNEIILTPHPKEFSRFIKKDLQEVLNNKVELTVSTSKDLNCTTILKGAGTIIVTNKGMVNVSPFANSALAKGGTGDVLAGFIGGLISQGVSPHDAACLAVYIHGKTGDIIAKEKTEYSLLPQDLITYLPMTLKSLCK